MDGFPWPSNELSVFSGSQNLSCSNDFLNWIKAEITSGGFLWRRIPKLPERRLRMAGYIEMTLCAAYLTSEGKLEVESTNGIISLVSFTRQKNTFL